MNLCSGGRKDRSNIFSGIIYPDFRYEKNIFLCVCLYHWVEQRLNKTANKRRVSFFFQYSAGRISQELQHKDVIFWDWCGLPNEGLAGHWLNTNQKIFFSCCLKVTSQSAWTTSSFMFHTYIQEEKNQEFLLEFGTLFWPDSFWQLAKPRQPLLAKVVYEKEDCIHSESTWF